jgi:BNR repeat-like domain
MPNHYRRRLWTVAALGVSLLLGFSSGITASAGSLVQISSDPYTNTTSNHKTQVEPGAFAFGQTIVSAVQTGRFFDGGASNIGFATSTNGGSTWTHGFLPSSTVYASPPGTYARASDPSVAYDAKHHVWLISWLGIVATSGPVDVKVSRSTDGGLTWGPPVTVNASGDFNDKNWTTCDDTATSPFYGRCYTEFDDNTKLNLLQVSTSKDGGLTWGAATTNPDHTCVIGGQPVVQPSGKVVMPIDDCQETNLLSVTSKDGGATWSHPAFVSQVLNDGHPGSLRSPDLPSAGVDKSGRVYVVWTDCRDESFCNAGNNDLLLSTSTNGSTWTVAKRIPASPVNGGQDDLLPGLGVDRNSSGGSANLAIVYYYFPSISCTPSTCQLDVGFIASHNGGTSWSNATQLAGPMTPTWLPLTTQGYMVGDYFASTIVPGDSDANPIFMVANAPTPPPNCSQTNGTPGQGCDQATYTTPEDALTLAGGTNLATIVGAGATRPSLQPSTPQTAY